MKQEFRASRHHLATVFPVAPPPSTAVVASDADVLPSPQTPSHSDAVSEPADEDRDDDEDDDDMDDMSSVEDQGPSHSGSSSRAAARERGTQAMFLNFTSDLEPHTKSGNKSKKASAFRVNGVNILNRKTAIERMQRRRENHNHVERRRRDNINNTILELSRIIPNAEQVNQKLNKGNVLKLALDYILDMQKENQKLREANQQLDRTTDKPQLAAHCRTDLLTHPEISPSHKTLLYTPQDCNAPTSPETTSPVLPPLSSDPIRHSSFSTDDNHPAPTSPSPSHQNPPILPPLDFEKLYGNTCRY